MISDSYTLRRIEKYYYRETLYAHSILKSYIYDFPTSKRMIGSYGVHPGEHRPMNCTQEISHMYLLIHREASDNISKNRDIYHL